MILPHLVDHTDALGYQAFWRGGTISKTYDEAYGNISDNAGRGLRDISP